VSGSRSAGDSLSVRMSQHQDNARASRFGVEEDGVHPLRGSACVGLMLGSMCSSAAAMTWGSAPRGFSQLMRKLRSRDRHCAATRA